MAKKAKLRKGGYKVRRHSGESISRVADPELVDYPTASLTRTTQSGFSVNSGGPHVLGLPTAVKTASVERRAVDKRVDNSRKKHPRNPDVRDICKELARRWGKGESQREIALSFAEGDKVLADSLLRAAHRYKWLWQK